MPFRLVVRSVRRAPWISISAVAVIGFLVAGAQAPARTWLVPLDAPTVAAGLDSASAGDSVLVASGTYFEQGLVLKSGIVLASAAGDPDSVTIDAEQAGIVLFCNGVDSTASVEAITISGGQAPGTLFFGCAGGGAHLEYSSARFTNCTFTGNVAVYGAGMGCLESSPRLENCVFDGNWASGSEWAAGGGFYCRGGAPELVECTFVDNGTSSIATTSDGGGVFCDNSDLVATDCIFDSNTSEVGAGGFYSFSYDRATLTGCIFQENQAAAGGAMYFERSYADVVGCTFTGNEADNGGAVFCESGSAPEFEDCLFEANTAGPHAGGAIDCWGSSPTARGCTFLANTAVNGGGGVVCRGGSSFAGEDCFFLANSTARQGGGLWCKGPATAALTSCTFYDNAAAAGAGGVHVYDGGSATLMQTIVAFSAAGEGVGCEGGGSADLFCCDVYGNAGGDWIGCIESQLGTAGNFWADPQFCDSAGGDFHLTLPDSPCLAVNSACSLRVGVLDAGCGCPAGASVLVPMECPTIGAALSGAEAGDVIGICCGEYEEVLTLVQGVHLKGARADLCRVFVTTSAPPYAVVHAAGVSESTVVAELTLDGCGVVPQVVLVEAATTGLHLQRNRITGGATVGVHNASDSRVRIGGALEYANDLFANGDMTPFHVRNENVTGDSLDALLNYWGTQNYLEILAAVEGPVRTCPITDVTHTKSLCAPVSAVGAPVVADSPAGLRLTVAPNPFRDASRILFTVDRDGAPVSVRLFNVAGRVVQVLEDRPLSRGAHTVVWDGRDRRGSPVGAGVYFVRLEVDSESLTRRLIRVR
jgi:hypothetical protein